MLNCEKDSGNRQLLRVGMTEPKSGRLGEVVQT